MKNTTKFLISLTTSLVIFLMFLIPVFSFAQTKTEDGQEGGLIPCGRAVYPPGHQTITGVKVDPSNGESENILVNDGGTVINPCGFNDLMYLVNNVIHFILFYLAIPVVAIMFAYAGFLLVTAGGEAAGARTKAKGIFLNAVIGLVIAVAAYLIIKTILSILGYEGSWIGF